MSKRSIPRSIEDSYEDEIHINKSGWKLKGWSRAGCQTGFMLYPHKILLDAGLCTSQKVDHVFLSHQHVDHVHNLPLVCSRHKPELNNIYLPNDSKDVVTKFFRVVNELSRPTLESLEDDHAMFAHQNIMIHGCKPGDWINIPAKNLAVEVLEAHHDVPCHGYGFNTVKSVVKAELAGHYKDLIESKDFDGLKQFKFNTNNFQIQHIPEFVYFCDSTINNLTLHDEWKRYPCIIVECTGLFVDANAKGNRDFDENHTSLSALRPVMCANKDKRWILIHVSMKVPSDKIREIESLLCKEDGLDVYICKGEF